MTPRSGGRAELSCFVFFIFFVLFIFDHFVYQEKIAINGAIYIQKGENITSLPANNMKLGHLRSITHNSTSDPSINFTATNLDESMLVVLFINLKIIRQFILKIIVASIFHLN